MQRVIHKRLLWGFVEKTGLFHCYNRCDLDVKTVILAYPIKYNKLTRTKQGKYFEALHFQK